MPARSMHMSNLPSNATLYVAVIPVQTAAALFTLTALGIVQAGVTGHGIKPNGQITRPDGTIQRFQIIKSEVKWRWISTSHIQGNLSEPLNDALARMFGKHNAAE